MMRMVCEMCEEEVEVDWSYGVQSYEHTGPWDAEYDHGARVKYVEVSE